MIRQTSIDVYNQIKAEGLLSKVRLQVYEAILNTAPCTSGEAFATMLTKSNVISQSRARFTELRNLGVIKEIGTKKCSITGRNVILWDLTNELPTELDKKEVKPKGIKKAIEYVIKKMDDSQIIFIDKNDLKTMIYG